MPSRSNAIRGRINKANGQAFEEIIDRACQYYREAGIAEISKTPEPVRQLGRVDQKGHFTACYIKRAQPDYQGTMEAGRSVVFEAKCTSRDRVQQSAVLPWQAQALDSHAALGATCFILVAFGMQKFYRIPWETWKDMGQRFGHKYITPQDVYQYQIYFSGARTLIFLPQSEK